MSLQHYISQSLAGTAVSVTSYLATGIDQVPAWLREFGLPVVMLAGAIWAVVFLYKELKAERAARIADRDAFIAMQKEDRNRTDEFREAQLTATIEQTAEIKNLTREIMRDRK